MKTCPLCGAKSKGNDGISEWFTCGSLVCNDMNRVLGSNQTKSCLQGEVASLLTHIQALEAKLEKLENERV